MNHSMIDVQRRDLHVLVIVAQQPVLKFILFDMTVLEEEIFHIAPSILILSNLLTVFMSQD